MNGKLYQSLFDLVHVLILLFKGGGTAAAFWNLHEFEKQKVGSVILQHKWCVVLLTAVAPVPVARIMADPSSSPELISTPDYR